LLTIYDLAESAGYSPSTISRLERGQVTPTIETAERLSTALGLDGEHTAKLRELASFRDKTEHATSASDVAIREAQASQIRIFHWATIPTLLQTESYMRGVLGATSASQETIEAACSSRLPRQSILEKTIVHVVLSEYALRSQFTNIADHLTQLAFLLELTRADRLDIGIIPSSRTLTFLAPCSFQVYDDTGVVFLADDTEFECWESEMVPKFLTLFAEIKSAASYGREMMSMVEKVMQELGSPSH